MAGPALGALLLLLLAGRASEGELCPQEGALRCPQQRDGADAQMCCGVCHLFSCCPAGEAQLGRQRCPREVPDIRDPSTTQPSSPTKLSTEASTHKFMEGWAGLLAFAGLLVGITLWSIFRYWKKQRWHQQRPVWHPDLLNLWNSGLTRLEEFDLSSFLGTPPPYATDPPPYSEEQPDECGSSPLQVVPFHHSSPGSSEEEVMLGPLVHRSFATSCSSESTLEEDPSADQ